MESHQSCIHFFIFISKELQYLELNFWKRNETNEKSKYLLYSSSKISWESLNVYLFASTHD